jgi:hypothetical protein
MPFVLACPEPPCSAIGPCRGPIGFEVRFGNRRNVRHSPMVAPLERKVNKRRSPKCADLMLCRRFSCRRPSAGFDFEGTLLCPRICSILVLTAAASPLQRRANSRTSELTRKPNKVFRRDGPLPDYRRLSYHDVFGARPESKRCLSGLEAACDTLGVAMRCAKCEYSV